MRRLAELRASDAASSSSTRPFSTERSRFRSRFSITQPFQKPFQHNAAVSEQSARTTSDPPPRFRSFRVEARGLGQGGVRTVALHASSPLTLSPFTVPSPFTLSLLTLSLLTLSLLTL
eukprot:1701541-Rhodomonas_salina.1